VAVTLDEIRDNFSLLDDWEDRYRYVIELGKELEPLAEGDHSEDHKVRGCVSQVWLKPSLSGDKADPVVTFLGDSDALIVRGLIAILHATYSGKRASEVLRIDPEAIFNELNLREHLTPQRSNGLRSMVERLRKIAQDALA
jgi:cysteine desulfuration protein SufE